MMMSATAFFIVCIMSAVIGQTVPQPNMPPAPVADRPVQYSTPTPSSSVEEKPQQKETIVFTLPIASRRRALDFQEEQPIEVSSTSNSTGYEMMAMVYPAVSGNQANKYGSLNLYGNTIEYYITVAVGSPAQIFTLQIDTGSAITALPATACADCYHYNPLYDSALSTTANVLSCADERCTSGACNDDGTCKFKVSYGDSSYIAGNLVSEMVGLPAAYTINNGPAGNGSTVLEVTSTLFANTPIIFGAITEASEGFQTHGADGIMGLSFGGSKLSCVPNCASLFMDSVVDKWNIPDIFSIALQPISNNSIYNTAGGSITLGGIDAAFLGSNTVHYTKVINTPYYSVLLGDISIGSHSVGAESFEFGNTIVDSGTTFTFVPPVVFDLIKKTMQTNYCHLPFVCGEYSIFTNSTCVNPQAIDLTQFPDFTFVFDGVKVVMKPEQYMLEMPTIKGQARCLSIMAGSPQKTILGDSFMMGVYTIFDRESKRIGFANDYLVSAGPAITLPPNNTPLIAGAAGGGAALILIVVAVILTVVLRRRAALKRDANRTVDIDVEVA